MNQNHLNMLTGEGHTDTASSRFPFPLVLLTVHLSCLTLLMFVLFCQEASSWNCSFDTISSVESLLKMLWTYHLQEPTKHLQEPTKHHKSILNIRTKYKPYYTSLLKLPCLNVQRLLQRLLKTETSFSCHSTRTAPMLCHYRIIKRSVLGYRLTTPPCTKGIHHQAGSRIQELRINRWTETS